MGGSGKKKRTPEKARTPKENAKKGLAREAAEWQTAEDFPYLSRLTGGRIQRAAPLRRHPGEEPPRHP
ncbi:hypothetical protein NDU88_007148 [Pleurodeles waltl]|uniref:Uncharacterized protein n=1 Tax=Pleurodeles waltl TaxID=8319 RepID=A0AAV7PSN7_PLEWA|nr:hypothetical protein NDU88_007148 [Pleurodeles waltl]